MKTQTIRQRTTIPASPTAVYDAWMTSRGHATFTGAAAKVSGKVGGRFSAWDGYIHGRNVELARGKRIVQDWRPSEADWPEDYYSRVSIRLIAVPAGTRIEFTQTGVLVQYAEELARGWKDFYWTPLRGYFENRLG